MADSIILVEGVADSIILVGGVADSIILVGGVLDLKVNKRYTNVMTRLDY